MTIPNWRACEICGWESEDGAARCGECRSYEPKPKVAK